MRQVLAVFRPVLSLALLLVLLAGCGSSGPRPGTALDLDGHTVSTAHVNDVATRYCAALTKVGSDNPVPASAIRTQVVSALAARLAAQRYAAAQGLQPGPAYTQQIAQLRPQLTAFSPQTQDAIIEVEGAQSYVSSIVDSSQQQAFTAWLGKQDVVVNPVYGLELQGENITRVDSSVSLATSKTAKAAVKAAGDPSGQTVVPGGRTCG
jgi:hypothetical protein